MLAHISRCHNNWYQPDNQKKLKIVIQCWLLYTMLIQFIELNRWWQFFMNGHRGNVCHLDGFVSAASSNKRTKFLNFVQKCAQMNHAMCFERFKQLNSSFKLPNKLNSMTQNLVQNCMECRGTSSEMTIPYGSNAAKSVFKLLVTTTTQINQNLLASSYMNESQQNWFQHD